jgi:uncharacterized protein YidB (DUF937 family)
MSPLMMALLALLATKAMQGRGGGLGDILGNVFGGRQDGPQGRPQNAPQQHGGSLGDEPFGGGAPPRGGDLGIDTSSLYPPGTVPGSDGGQPGGAPHGASQGGGGLGGALGGGVLGGLVGTGLGGLIEAFQRSGHGDVVNSWVGRGQNQPIPPGELGNVLGDDTLNVLEQQTGMPRDQLLSELSDTLPEVVDQLTPAGRPPTDEDLSRW